MVPATALLLMLAGSKFPKTERAAAGIPMSDMLKAVLKPGFAVWFIAMLLTSAAELAPGSYLVTASVPGRPTVRLPVRLGRGERRAEEIQLPAQVPAGFVYVPAGRFLYGSADLEELRGAFFNTAPLHEVATGPYLIARHETTFADWLADAQSRAQAWLNDVRRSPRRQRRDG